MVLSQSSWPGAELASASAIKRAATRQAFVLAVVGGTAAGLTFASFRVPEPVTKFVIVLAALGVLVEVTVVMIERDRTVQQADRLIEQGFAFDRRTDITSVTVAERVAYLNSSKHRIALVRMCQQQLDLASAGESPIGYPQPYISIATLAQNADVLRRIIAKLNQGAGLLQCCGLPGLHMKESRMLLHANAKLGLAVRRAMVCAIEERHMSQRQAAVVFNVSLATANRESTRLHSCVPRDEQA